MFPEYCQTSPTGQACHGSGHAPRGLGGCFNLGISPGAVVASTASSDSMRSTMSQSSGWASESALSSASSILQQSKIAGQHRDMLHTPQAAVHELAFKMSTPQAVHRSHCSRQLRTCRVQPPLCRLLAGLPGIWTCTDLSRRSGTVRAAASVVPWRDLLLSEST